MFHRTLPTKSMCVKVDIADGGNKAKDRISVLLACSAAGENLTPFVTGRSANPRGFQGLARSACPVSYSSNKKAWMTAELFQQWLDKLNSKIR